MEIIGAILAWLIYALILYLIICVGNPEYRELTFHQKKLLDEAQKTWNEYSKDMTLDERYEVYSEWCEDYKYKHGLHFILHPSIHGAPYTRLKVNLDGKVYIGTIEEIAKESGWPRNQLYKIAHKKYEHE